MDNKEMGAFGLLVSAMTGDDSVFPREDALDLTKGARFIPNEVTMARRAGQQVEFVQDGHETSWYWLMPNGAHLHYRP